LLAGKLSSPHKNVVLCFEAEAKRVLHVEEGGKK